MKYSVEFAIQTKKNFILWAHELHNCVNSELGKELVDIEKLYDKYRKEINLDSDSNNTCTKNC
jgi:hypothetical protein